MSVVRTISQHPLAAMAVCFVLLFILYLICKKLIKLALVCAIVLLAVGGYFYFQYPEERPADVKEALQKARTGTEKAVEKGRDVVEKGRELAGKGKEAGIEAVEKGRELVDRGETFLERAARKGKAVLDVVKKAGREIGKIMTGER